jgi:hypothetical protein
MTGSSLESLRSRIAHDGFALAAAAEMRPLFGEMRDWPGFASSWNDLMLDTHLPEGHRYRRRRYATLSAHAGESTFRVEPHQPHYQHLEYNPLVGGIERWFEPIARDILESESFRRIMALTLALYTPLKPTSDWHIEVHQFRIEARPEAAGEPTPEGVHRDGVDYVLVLLVARSNIESGTTTVHAMDGMQLGSFTLATPLDAALVDDARVKHGVTAVRPLDPSKPACRDVLVITLRAK